MAGSNLKMLPLRFLCICTTLILFLNIEVHSVVADDVSGILCNEDLTSFLPALYSDSSRFTCRSLWNGYILRFFQSEDHVLTVVLSTEYMIGWVGMGFSKNGLMVNSSAMVGWVNNEGRARIKQYYLRGSKPSQVKPDEGNLNVTSSPIVAVHGATIYLAFQLKFAARLHTENILLAFGSKTPLHAHLSKHEARTSIIFDFSTGTASAANNFDGLKRNHGILGLIGWGMLLPTGAIIARYYKHRDPLWYYLHISIQFVGFIFGLAAVVAGKVLYGKLHANVKAHRGIGIFVLVLSILQILAFFIRPDKDSKFRKFWNWYHQWFGRFALFFGVLNIALGIQNGGAGSFWVAGYWVLVAVLLITVIILEVLLRIGMSRKTVGPPAFQMNPSE
ncbi:cytochrome b561 and DOMON domain-containing protein At3g61750 [Macadamia integrifolia]|uniref:cytochrome b561 and DOMON domain-containing protein At3g61750 n=1 Tax=Macadamia integrifolia TaxID=60698 RepID=UPI001C4FC01A|nr:cytochrome b561 and DOMON domain-containing protein At3g61750 [Macadamia integrifolia]XP_042505781.1 cytochrome b561 and DOMON domain-containing protein At3g61750 [Macadamia integrifolia]XP_042505782.1 cytochrome b561 and DOMON domain-containing protein At3g61750 [Macadamia integrifolia]XP_042505783.1 cytochrome b561 and DOMON domain-containing protein At3g61750 [Macadamia integrifolia]